MKDTGKTAGKKPYEKPLARKRKAVALVSGSGCGVYRKRTSGGFYYH